MYTYTGEQKNKPEHPTYITVDGDEFAELAMLSHRRTLRQRHLAVDLTSSPGSDPHWALSGDLFDPLFRINTEPTLNSDMF